MTRYVVLLKFTEQGSQNIKESTTRAHAFAKLAARSKVKIEGQFWTVGSHDGVVVMTADTEERIVKLLTELASLGNVRTQSLQAFTDKEFDRILNS